MSKGKVIKKALIIIIILILGVSAIFFIGLQSMLNKFSKEVSKIKINDINLSAIHDGVYTGEYYVNDSVGATVKVTVQNNKITRIDFIEHKHGRGQKAEVITNKVIKEQSLNVDTISGATGSSKIILKAIENALNQGTSR